MGRLLTQLQTMHPLSNNKKQILSEGCRQDIFWWHRYLRRFNGVELLYKTDPFHGLTIDQLTDIGSYVNCGDAQPSGGGSYYGSEYWSRSFPAWLCQEDIPIHIKEFWVVLVSAWLWGEDWTGKLVYIFCDNDAVVEVLDKERPKDTKMQELLREFMYIVCTRKFSPVFRKIGSRENHIADYISRCHDPIKIDEFFQRNKLPARKPRRVLDNLFTLQSNW